MFTKTTKTVVVIGAGPGGYACAIRLAQQGHSVTLIEKESLGGTCLNWGCIPSKAFIHVGEFYHQLMSGSSTALGITAENVQLDWTTTLNWKNALVSRLRGGIGQLLTKHKITVLTGEATVTPEHRVLVTKTTGEVQTLHPEAIVLSMGSSPSVPSAYQSLIDGKFILTSNHLLTMPTLPKTLAIIGGGVIGLELGCMLAHLGVTVDIIESQPAILTGWHPETVKVFTQQLQQLGVTLHLNTTVAELPQINQEEQTVHLQLQHAVTTQSTTQVVDKVLLCTGRKPNTQGLTAVGIALSDTGHVVVNNKQQTNIPSIYAIGDLVTGPQLAHKATREGLLVADVISGLPEVKDWRAIPAVIYTAPELAQVGWNEQQAKENGYPHAKTTIFPLGALGRSHTLSNTPSPKGHFIVVTDAQTDVVLGAEVIAPHAGELIGELALAVECSLTATDIALTMHAHPTLSEGWMEAAEAVHQQAIHLFQAGR
jgi:dihydrolipoamide dehydrogenase